MWIVYESNEFDNSFDCNYIFMNFEDMGDGMLHVFVFECVLEINTEIFKANN